MRYPWEDAISTDAIVIYRINKAIPWYTYILYSPFILFLLFGVGWYFWCSSVTSSLLRPSVLFSLLHPSVLFSLLHPSVLFSYAMGTGISCTRGILSRIESQLRDHIREEWVTHIGYLVDLVPLQSVVLQVTSRSIRHVTVCGQWLET